MCTCEIVLNNNKKVYLTGQEISGIGNVIASRRIYASEVFVRLTGHARVKWMSMLEDVAQTGFQNFFDLTFNKLKQEHLPAGKTPFQFSIQLPWQLPATITRIYGNITYQISFGVQVPTKKQNEVKEIVAKENIILLKTLNFKVHPELMSPIYKTAVRHFKIGWFKAGLFYVKIELDHNGYKPGDHVNYKIRMTNYSLLVTIREMRILLELELAFIANDYIRKPTKHDRKITQKIKQRIKVEPHTTEYLNGSIVIPANAEASHTQGIIRTAYKLYFEFQGCTGNKHSHIYLPITVGMGSILTAVNETVYQENNYQKVTFKLTKNA